MTSTFRRQISRISSDETLPESTSSTVNQPETFRRSRLYRAIRKGDPTGVLRALRRGANVHLYDEQDLTTYLHLAVSHASADTEVKQLPCIYLLGNAGIEVNAHDSRGRTALERAIDRGLRHTMVALIRIGTDLRERDFKSLIHRIEAPSQEEMLDYFERFEPGLWQAVKSNDLREIQILLNSWCRVNITKNNKTLIEYAELTRKPHELIALLRDSEHNLEFIHATLAGDERRMRQLQEAKRCDHTAMDISHIDSETDMLLPRSLRDTVIDMQLTNVLDLLPKAEVTSNESDSEDDDQSDGTSQWQQYQHSLSRHDSNGYGSDEGSVQPRCTYILGADDDSESSDDVSSSKPQPGTHSRAPKLSSSLRLDLGSLRMDDDADGASIEAQHQLQQQYIENSAQNSARDRRRKKFKDQFGKSKSTKQQQRGSTDEGYNSTMSSVQSEAGNSPPLDTRAGLTRPGSGAYLDNRSPYFYTTASDSHGIDGMLNSPLDGSVSARSVASTTAGRKSSRHAGVSGVERSLPRKAGKAERERRKKAEEEARYENWLAEDSEGEARAPDTRRRRGGKARRRKSIKQRFMGSGGGEDESARSKMCVIQ